MGRISQAWRQRLGTAAWPRHNCVADAGRLGDLEVLAASVIGQGHLHDGLQRQDAYYFAPVGNGAVLAVADGVSARSQAAIGAETAVFAAVRSYLAALAAEEERRIRFERDRVGEPLLEAVERAEEAVRATAAQLRLEPRELSTTLLLADLRWDAAGRIVVTTAGLGNSSALMLRGAAAPTVVGGPPEGGSPTDFHHFIPGASESARLERTILPEDAALVLATDGLADDLHASAKVRAWLWDRLIAASTPIEFAHALSYRRQGSTDDLTAIVAWPNPRP